jgi:hypothetical protein
VKKALIGNQDDGAYSNFTCAVTPPASVLTVWNWAPGTRHPRSGD